jgi:hypothetical protein
MSLCKGRQFSGFSHAKVQSRCCPTGYSCGVLSNTLVGCCPSGTVCSGFTGQVTTITINNNVAVFTTGVATNAPFVGVGSPTTTAMVSNAAGGVFIGTQQTKATGGGVQTGGGVFISPTYPTFTLPPGFSACSTMVMNGDFLPTTRQAPCGTMLIVPGSATMASPQDSWLLLLVSLLSGIFI